MRRCWAGP
jgi:hypothetical protein